MKTRHLLLLLILIIAALFCFAACDGSNITDDPPLEDEYVMIGSVKCVINETTYLALGGFHGIDIIISDEDAPTLAKLTKLESLYIYIGTITNLDFLLSMPDLVTLCIYKCPDLADISAISSLKNLVRLRLFKLNIDNLPPMDDLQALKILELPGCKNLKGYDFSRLAVCKNLTSLIVDGITKVNLESIADLICGSEAYAFELIMHWCDVQDISPLSRVADKIVSLDISYNLMPNDQLALLENFVNLNSLYIGVNLFTDLTPLINLAKLGKLTYVRDGSLSSLVYSNTIIPGEGMPPRYEPELTIPDDYEGIPDEQWSELWRQLIINRDQNT